jgi:hypothetical protein
MTSALGPNGSSRLWRKLRRLVLDRDGWSCRFPVEGGLCGAYARVAGHIVARSEWPAGVPGVDDPANLRAECDRHSSRAGALIRHGLPADLPPIQPYRSEHW